MQDEHRYHKRAIISMFLCEQPFVAFYVKYPRVDAGFFVDYANERGILQIQLGADPAVMGIPDLELTEEGWSGTLCRQGRLAKVFVPWESVVAMFVHRPGEDVPRTIVQWPYLSEALPEPEKKDRSHLKLC